MCIVSLMNRNANTANTDNTKGNTMNRINATIAAAAFGIDGRSFRRFLRAMDKGVGRGSTYDWASLRTPALLTLVRNYHAARGTVVTTKDLRALVS